MPKELLVDQVREALGGTHAVTCPYSQTAPQGALLYAVPNELRRLVVLHHKRSKQAAEMLKNGNSQDNGLWFRTKSKADAVEAMLVEALCAQHKEAAMLESHLITYYADWQYSFS